ncbi:MAG: S-layer homology domain-containing protein [Ruminiclostridium sp.]|nr:S-layer homology domain-containing protein [Ruminiclostridium sp.]
MKRLLAVILALVMGLLPVSSLAVELPGIDGDFTFSREDLEEMFNPDQYKDLWGELENVWGDKEGSGDDLENILGDLKNPWEDAEDSWEGPEISVEDIMNLWDLYEDLDPTRWYWNAVEFCLESGLMQGLEMGMFGPDETTTRAQLVTILWRLDGSPYQTGCADLPFEDVKANAWYAQAVCWAYENEIAAGHSETGFAPNEPITREQLVTMLYRYAVENGFDVASGLINYEVTNINEWIGSLFGGSQGGQNKSKYKDFNEISDWAVTPMKWAVGAKIISGTDSTHLSPKEYATRAQIATVFYNFCNVVVDEIE